MNMCLKPLTLSTESFIAILEQESDVGIHIVVIYAISPFFTKRINPSVNAV
jgi:hypothetical protein